jgi:cellulose synthase (UDP-forming)
VQDNFIRHERSDALRLVTQGSIVFAVAIFVLMQLVRFGLYYKIAIHHPLPRHHFFFYAESAVFVILLLAELLVLAQLLGNIFFSWLSASHYRTINIPPFPGKAPPVAALVPTCNEDPDILERSIRSVTNFDYPGLQPLIIENSTDLRLKAAAHQLADRYGAQIVDVPNERTKASALNAADPFLRDNIEYLAIFDADQSVERQMISDMIPLFEGNHRLALIQTAQLYESDGSLLNCAISQSLVQSYDNLQEAFSVLGCALCYGTNFIIRREALRQVGGWDVGVGTVLTEDLSTSFLLHLSGWKSLYVRRAYAKGIAPPTLEAFWRQQRRWATGVTCLFFKLIASFCVGRLRQMRPLVVATYAIASSYYTSVAALALLVFSPSVIALFYLFTQRLPSAATDTPSHAALSSGVWLFVSLYPLYVLTTFFPYINMKLRGYRLRNMVLVQSLLVLSAGEYIKGVRDALFDRGPGFVTTGKILTNKNRGRPIFLMTQTYAFLAFVVTGALVSGHMVANSTSGLSWIMLFWLGVNSVCLGHVFIFRYGNKARQTNVSSSPRLL